MAVASSSTLLAERVSCYCAMFVALMLVMSCCEVSESESGRDNYGVGGHSEVVLKNRAPCDEIYVVKEGDTLHTIGEKCGDPYIVEENPHIHDPDDVFPGLVIKINPFQNR